MTGGGVQTSGGSAIIILHVPSSNWANGNYFIRATVSGSSGSAIIKGGSLRVKDMVAPNITILSPSVNASITGASFNFNATTTENANCYLTLIDYGSFYKWNCNFGNSSNYSSSSSLLESCNITKYNFNNSTIYYNEYLTKDYHSASSGANYDYWYKSGATGLVTDGIYHSYVFNTTNKANNTALAPQNYGINIWCYDSDWNYASAYSAIKINVTT